MGDIERQDSTNQAEDQGSDAEGRDEQQNAARTRAVEDGQESAADAPPADDVIIIK